MKSTEQLAKHIRELHFGGNWTVANLQDLVSDVTWEQATTQIHSLNTIATLVYHTHYFIDAVSGVLDGEPLTSQDKYSFDHPPVNSEEDWQKLLRKVWKSARKFADQIEELPDSILWEDFTDGKYGIYYRNFLGIIEHTHYHMGQISLIKKMIQQENGIT